MMAQACVPTRRVRHSKGATSSYLSFGLNLVISVTRSRNQLMEDSLSLFPSLSVCMWDHNSKAIVYNSWNSWTYLKFWSFYYNYKLLEHISERVSKSHTTNSNDFLAPFQCPNFWSQLTVLVKSSWKAPFWWIFRELILGLAPNNVFPSKHLMIFHVKLKYHAIFLKHHKSWIIHYSIWNESAKQWLEPHDKLLFQTTGLSGTWKSEHSVLSFFQSQEEAWVKERSLGILLMGLIKIWFPIIIMIQDNPGRNKGEL